MAATPSATNPDHVLRLNREPSSFTPQILSWAVARNRVIRANDHQAGRDADTRLPRGAYPSLSACVGPPALLLLFNIQRGNPDLAVPRIKSSISS
jgi:hypothetical protein